MEEQAIKLLEERAANRISVPPIPLGSAVASVLFAVGVTEERVKKLVGGDCGCSKRKHWLNEAGVRAAAVIQDGLNAVANQLLPNPVTDDEVAEAASAMRESPFTNYGQRRS